MGPRPTADIPAGMWDFPHGYAAMRAGNTQRARQYPDRMSSTSAPSDAVFKFHSAKVLLGTLAGILEGEIDRMAGDVKGAIVAFERAVALNDTIILDDPEPLPFPARHWLGAALLEAERFADAERIYRVDHQHRPHSGWSRVGLQRARKGQGKSAATVDADLQRSWARADTPIKASRF